MSFGIETIEKWFGPLVKEDTYYTTKRYQKDRRKESYWFINETEGFKSVKVRISPREVVSCVKKGCTPSFSSVHCDNINPQDTVMKEIGRGYYLGHLSLDNFRNIRKIYSIGRKWSSNISAHEGIKTKAGTQLYNVCVEFYRSLTVFSSKPGPGNRRNGFVETGRGSASKRIWFNNIFLLGEPRFPSAQKKMETLL